MSQRDGVLRHISVLVFGGLRSGIPRSRMHVGGRGRPRPRAGVHALPSPRAASVSVLLLRSHLIGLLVSKLLTFVALLKSAARALRRCRTGPATDSACCDSRLTLRHCLSPAGL